MISLAFKFCLPSTTTTSSSGSTSFERTPSHIDALDVRGADCGVSLALWYEPRVFDIFETLLARPQLAEALWQLFTTSVLGTTMSESTSNLSHTHGRIQWHDKLRYYSPNSALDTPLIVKPPDPKTLESNPFKPGQRKNARVRYRDFVFPRLWTSLPFAWISFTPVIPSQVLCDRHSYFAQVLSQYPRINRFTDETGRTSGYRVPVDNAWVRLEKDLYGAVVALSGHYHIPCVLPFLPGAIGYQEMYPQKRYLKGVLEQSRDWFFVWFGALSYLVASLRSPWTEDQPAQLDHQWCNVLRSRGVSLCFIDALPHSLVTASQGIRRAGIVLNMSDCPKGQQTPEWFVEQGVPVWYQWGEKEERVAAVSQAYRDIRPPSPLLRQNPLPHRLLDIPPAMDVPSASSVSQDQVPAAMEPCKNTPLTLAVHNPAPTQSVGSGGLDFPSPSTPECIHWSPASPTQSTMQTSRHTSPIDVIQSGRETPPPLPTLEEEAAASELAVHTSYQPAGMCEQNRASSGTSGGRGVAAVLHEPEWVIFFREREQRRRAIMRDESPKDRQRRENREREPATSSAKVFEWYASAKPGIRYERFPVLAKARLDTLGAYSDAQKRYDPFYNEWDCSDEWGPDDDDDDEGPLEQLGDGVVDSGAVPIPPSIAASFVCVDKSLPCLPPSYTEADCPTSAFDESESSSADGNSFAMDVAGNLGYFYGFQFPISAWQDGHALPHYTEKQKTFFLRILGTDPSYVLRIENDDRKLFHTAHEYVMALCNRRSPPPGTCDIEDQCVRPVRQSHRFKCIRLTRLDERHKADTFDTTERYYVFDDGNGENTWKLGVTAASDALLACRLPESYTTFELAEFLVQYGVPFRTFYPSRMVPRSPPMASSLALQIPQRPFGHKFTKEDYDAYIHMRTLLLGQSHMQAALKRGGIIWRLAVGTLGISRVTTIPSLWASQHEITLGGTVFIDDVLTTTELDLLCGVYECVSDDGKQRSLKSWWPLARYYEKEECGENYGHWTQRREGWYTKRLREIECGELGRHQPLTYTEWKSTQRGPAAIRTLHACIERSSSRLVERHASGSFCDAPSPAC